MSWNIQSWTNNNCVLRKKVLQNIDPHFICLTETHLKGEETISMNGYTWFSNNRTVLHTRAKTGSGGCGIFVKDSIFADFTCEIVDKSKEGILCLKLVNKFSSFSFILYCCYLPPESSPRGRDAVDFYAHILSELYFYEECDMVLICGDLNSRIGTTQDYIADIDVNIGDRVILDKTKNKHGDCLIEFLKDAKCCVINGRVTPEFNNYTFMSHQGSSVNDYIIVNHEALQYFHKCKVLTRNDYLEQFDLFHYLTDECKASDHSIIVAEFNMLTYLEELQAYNESINTESVYNVENNTLRDTSYCKRYKFDNVSPQFMNSDVWNQSLLTLIETFENCINNQTAIDECYNKFCQEILHEMDRCLNYSDATQKVRKKFKYFKPYWTPELTELWKVMRDKENIFHNYEGHNRSYRQNLYQDYICSQRYFDKALRKANRLYKRGLCLELDEININNPAVFWKKT